MEGTHPYSRRPLQPSQSFSQFDDAPETSTAYHSGSQAHATHFIGQSETPSNTSPGRRKAVPASLELSQSNIKPFEAHKQSASHDFRNTHSHPPSVSSDQAAKQSAASSTSTPFTAKHLSYLAPDTSDEDSASENVVYSPTTGRPMHLGGSKPAGSSSDEPSSPSMSPPDRSRLVGLGELSTPRWASSTSIYQLSSSINSVVEPLPSLMPFDSPTAQGNSLLPSSASMMSLAASARELDQGSQVRTPSKVSPNPSLQSTSSASKSPSATMSAIDNLLGEFKDIDPESASSEDVELSNDLKHDRRRLSELGIFARQHHKQLPQPPAETSSPRPVHNKEDSVVGLGFDLPNRGPLRTRKPSGPRAPSTSSNTPTQVSKSVMDPTTTPNSVVRPQMLRQTSGHSQHSDVSFQLGSPVTLPSPRQSDKSPRTSVHHRRQSAGTLSSRSRSSSLHPQSPAHIAHAIARAAKEEGVDIDDLAGQDDDTAAALRRLDGLSASKSRSRESVGSSAASRRESAASLHKRSPSTDSKSRRPRSKSSLYDSNKPPPPPFDLSKEMPALPSPSSTASSPCVSISTSQKKVRSLSIATSGSASSAATLAPASVSREAASNLSQTTFMPSPRTATSPAPAKNSRRSSGGSEFSASGVSEYSGKRQSWSSESASNNGYAGPNTSSDASAIPPVPPLPKDFGTPSQPNSAMTEYFQPSTLDAPVDSPAQSISFSIEGSPRAVAAEIASSTGSSPAVTSPAIKSPSRKWSISNALHMGRSPSNQNRNSSGIKISADRHRLVRKSSTESASSSSLASGFSGKKYASSNDIATLASNDRPKQTRQSPSLTTIATTSSSRLTPRTRTRKESTDSCDTAMTAYRSTSDSLTKISERRKPESSASSSSGIPFFTRRDSATSQLSLTAASNSSSPESQQRESKEKDRSGRKSILGLNFLGRKGTKQSTQAKDANLTNAISSPKSTKTSRISVSTSRATSQDPGTEATGVRARLRNKSMASFSRKDELAVSAAIGMTSAQPGASSESSHSVASKPILTSRTSKTFEQPRKSPLPTIAGSPSVQTTAGSLSDKQHQHPQPSQTPTRIPRRVGNGSTSPRPSLMSEFGVVNAAEEALNKALGTSRNWEGDAGSRRTSSSSSSRSAIPKSQSTNAISSSGAVAGPRPLDKQQSVSLSAAPAARHVKRRSLLGHTLEKDKPASPITNRTPLRTTRRVSSPVTSQPSISGASVRRPSKSITAASARRESALADEASKPIRPRVAPSNPPATAVSSSKMSKSTTMPSLQIDERKRRDSSSATTSRRSTPVDDNEQRADQEMAQYVRRVTSKKLAAGVPSDQIRAMFEFPHPQRPTRGMSSKEASALFGRELSDYEKEEIRHFDTVYYVGQGSRKVLASRDNSQNNYGFDDERGDYHVVLGDHIMFRFEIMDVLGKGSFGQVLQCRDHMTGEAVAIKIIRNKNRFHKQAVVEIKVLDNLRKWDPEEKHNVIKMTDNFSFRNHLCIVTELLSINLYELIKANSFHGFSTTLIKRFAVQMLQSMTLLRHHRVVHCDLKPENVLLMHPCKSAVKVIDFGSSCFENEKVYTYIQSRFYRSIEVILGSNYHMAIDMWSLGCILAEMYTGMPLFPGENEQEQLACIMEVLGLPDRHLIDRSSRRKVFFDSSGAPRPVVNSKGRRRRPGSKSLAQVLKCEDEQFIDFIAKCLIFDPDRRMKPQTALRHPFIRPEVARVLSTPSATPSTRTTRHSIGAPSNHIAISTPRRKSAAHSTSATATPSAGSSASYLSHSTTSTSSAAATRRAIPSSSLTSAANSQRFAVK